MQPAANPRFPLKKWLGIGFAIHSVIGLLFFAHYYLDDLARGRHGTLTTKLLEEFSGAYSAALLFPAVVWMFYRFRFERERWPQILLAHLAGATVLSLLHTTLMAASRHLLAPILGLGPYDYGIMRLRYAMEYPFYLLGYTIITVTLHLTGSYQKFARERAARAQLEASLAEAQLQNLRLQLEPHFLFNALNAVSAIMYEDVYKADRMLTELGELLRRTLRPGTAQTTLQEELDTLRLFLDVMQCRMEEKLAIRWQIAPDLEAASIPMLLLQPLVENAIRHGADAASGRVEVEISAQKSGDSLVLRIADRGPGMAGGPITRGIGLTNTEQRLQLVYGNDYQLSFANAAPHGLVVAVSFPFRLVRRPAAQEQGALA